MPPRKVEAKPEAHPIEQVFEDVVHQLTQGKGQRHGGGTVHFYDQQWVQRAKVHGNGFLTGQAAKKLDEAVASGNFDLDPEAFERELLGVIVYVSMAILHRRGFPRQE